MPSVHRVKLVSSGSGPRDACVVYRCMLSTREAEGRAMASEGPDVVPAGPGWQGAVNFQADEP